MTRDIVGGYWFGAWRFYLPKVDFKSPWEGYFCLDGVAQNEPFLKIDGARDSHFGEAQVTFPKVPQRMHHDYENLRTSEDWAQQNLLRGNCPEPPDGLWDVIVVGTGMGGGILADALSDWRGKNIRVLALDAGGLDYDTHTDNMPTAALGRFVVENDNSIYETHDVITYDSNEHFGGRVTMNLGGRSVFWSGLIPRMAEWEMANFPASIAKYLRDGGYEAAEKLLRKHVAAGNYQEEIIQRMGQSFEGWRIENTPRSCHQPEFDSTGNPLPSFLFRSSGTFSTAELLVDSQRAIRDPSKSRLHLKLNHLVTRLETDGARTVTHVVCHDLGGSREVKFRGRHIVLAAGSLESAKIALLSQLNDSSGKIGIGFSDHPSYFSPNSGEFPLKKDSPFYGADKHARIFLYPTQPWEGHWFNVEVVINGRYWCVRHADDDVLKSRDLMEGGTTVKFKFIFGSPLYENNSVQLNSANKQGKVKVQVAWNPAGQAAANAVRNLAYKLLHFFGAEPVDLNLDHNFHYGAGGTPHHAGGSLRMTTPGKPGVVDENLKFNAYDNLYACDPSVYPYIPAANPSLTLAALAQRLTGHLASKF